MQQWVMSALGPDRPGLVDQLSEAISGAGGNIADARMINLRGQFAVVMLVESSGEQSAAAQRAAEAKARAMGLTATIATAGGQAADAAAAGVPYRIRTYAMDQVGLVHRITHALHTHRVNIEELTTRLEHGPHSGTPLFTMDMIVTIPHDMPLKRVRTALETLCEELNCDLDIDRA